MTTQFQTVADAQTTRPTPIKWTRLTPISLEDWCSPQLQEKASGFNKRINELLAGRKTANEMQSDLHNTDLADVDFTSCLTCSMPVEVVTESLQSELKLRRELIGFWDSHSDELRAEVEKARQDLVAAERKVRDGLVTLGYVDAEPTSQVIGKITPGFILTHPEVHGDRERYRALASALRANGRASENAAAVEQLESQLRRFVSRASGLVGPAK